MDHLACFLPGTLALGAMTGATLDAATAARHLGLAKKLVRCGQSGAVVRGCGPQ